METLFAVTAPGLGPITAQELRQLGLLPEGQSARPHETRLSGEESGGVAFRGGLADLYRANLLLRTASRVLLRLGDFFAAGFPELRKKAGRLAWERYLQPGQPVSMHVTCHKSKLYHSGAVAERVLAAIGDRLGKPSEMVKAEDGGSAAAQLVVVRLVNDHCTISIDTSGDLLHRRGYRLATAKAPLRETLAAAMLMAAAWDGVSPLVDPFCGSGTIVIEAARMALGIPPGSERKFAFMNWPGFNAGVWKAVWQSCQPKQAVQLPIIQASDRDAGAIELARANATRAGVEQYIEFTCQAVSAITPPRVPGWVVTNPPYGLRVSRSSDLRNLYAQFGNVLREKCPGWQVAILCNDLKLLGQTRLKLDTSFGMVNGGVSVRLGRGKVI